jgi:MFS-type transporter involved in bile tolerance (Atg22 family)
LLAGAYIPLYLISLVSDPSTSAGYIAAATSLGYILGILLAPAIGAFADRNRNAPELLLGVLLLLALAVLTMVTVHNAVVVSALAVVVAVASQWLTLLQNAILMQGASREGATTFFLANQLPYFAGFPLGVAVAISAISVSGSVANALALVGVLFALGAITWIRPMRRESRALAAMRAANVAT